MQESTSELYFRLGLDTSALQNGFDDAEKTLSQNIQTLNQQNNLIQLKAQVELAGLDEAVGSTEALRIQQEALNQQLAIQEDRIQLTAAAYQAMVQAQGENSQAAYNLAVRLEQERLAMAKLESQSQSLAEKDEIAFGVHWDMLGLIEPAFKVTDILVGARTAVTALGHAIPIPQLKLGIAALIGLSAVVSGTADATEELAESDSVQTFAGNIQSASTIAGNSFATIQRDAIATTDILDKSLRASSKNTSEQLQQQTITFEDWARDIFRIAFLLTEDSDNFTEAISKVNSQSQFMRTEIGNYAVVLAGINTILQALKNETINFVSPAIKNFAELKQHANELNMSLSETNRLQSLINLSQSDYNDVRDYVRGVQDAVIKGDSEDPEVIALKKYGVAIQNTNGELLSFNETLKNLYEGFLRAQDAGEEEAYIIMTNGQAVHDVLPFFKELANAKIEYNKIQWATSDYAALQQTSADIKLMNTQINEFYGSLQSLGLPLADYSAQAKFETYKKLTELIEENRETILKWEFVFIGVLDSIETKASNTLDKLKVIFNELVQELDKKINGEQKTADNNAETDFFSIDNLLKNQERRVLWNKQDVKLLYEVFPQLIPEGKTPDTLAEESVTKTLSETIKEKLAKYIDYFKESYEQMLSDAEQELEEYIAENERASEETQKTQEEINAGLSYSYNRIAKYKEELANIKIDLEFGDDEYGKAIAKLNVWRDKAMQDAKYYAEEQAIIAELYAAKTDQIEKEKENKLNEIRESIAAKRRTDLENALAEIEKEKEARINAGMEAAEAIKLAAEESAEAIKNLENAFTETVNNFRSNALEKQFAAIDKDRDNWIKKGIDPEEANAFADEQKQKARADLEESFSERINQIRNNELENQFARIEKEKQAWIDKGIDEERAEEFADEAKEKALDEYNDKLEKSTKKAKQGADEVKGHWERVGKSIDEQFNDAFSVLKSQLEAFRAYRDHGIKGLIEHERAELHKQGITDDDLKSMTKEALAGFQKALKDIRGDLLPNFNPQEEWQYITEPTKKQFEDLNKSVGEAAESELNKIKANNKSTESVQKFGEVIDKVAEKIPKVANNNQQANPNDDNPNDNQTSTPSNKTPKVTYKKVKVPPPYEFKGYAEGEGGKYWAFGRRGWRNKLINSKDYPDSLSALNDLNKGNPFYEQPDYNPEDMFKRTTDAADAVGQKLSDISDTLSDRTKSIGDFATAQQQARNSYNSQTIAPNISVNINEPHAWDSEHIQELADKVGDTIAPSVVKAIGGDSNSY